MTSRFAIRSLMAVGAVSAAVWARADSVQLVNGDSIRGKVVRMDEKHLVFRSDSFGELTIGRDKIDLIAIGDKPLPNNRHSATATNGTPAAAGSLMGQVAPLLQTPAAQQQLGPMVENLLGAGGLGDLQKNVANARQGLQDLKKDFGQGPESQVLDSYINLFNLVSPSVPAANAQKPRNTPRPSAPKATSPPRGSKQ
ncbi:MAG TPA: hypothetical protein VFG04_05135 [Planctomycetaceae bacterium]|jgi:hypothetical protein|nr:hypothetical protein [Planctomycetaceae bacterium]